MQAMPTRLAVEHHCFFQNNNGAGLANQSSLSLMMNLVLSLGAKDWIAKFKIHVGKLLVKFSPLELRPKFSVPAKRIELYSFYLASWRLIRS